MRSSGEVRTFSTPARDRNWLRISGSAGVSMTVDRMKRPAAVSIKTIEKELEVSNFECRVSNSQRSRKSGCQCKQDVMKKASVGVHGLFSKSWTRPLNLPLPG